MIRSMTSNVSALSGIVANGHQAIHFVSSAPSKIPYGGFSPVRLQTRLTPRPPSPARPRWLIGRYCSYLRPQRWIRNRSCDQTAPQSSDLNRESSGPWLPCWLCCPAGSLITTATSAPLSATRTVYELFRQATGPSPSAAEGPHFTLPIRSPRAAACTPVIPESALDDIFLPDFGLRHVLSGSAITSFHVFRIAWVV